MRVSGSMFFILIGLSVSAHAADGVLEINQICALHTGCFAGDAAGFPVTIGKSGSYVLTGDLDQPTGWMQPLIDIQVSNVSLDLAGFAIRGNGTGVVDAISGASSARHVEVSNGSMHDLGMWLRGWHARISRLRAHEAGTIECDRFCIVEKSLVSIGYLSSGNGVTCGHSCTVSESAIDTPQNAAIECGDRCRVTGSTVEGSDALGWAVRSGDHTQIVDSTLTNHFMRAVECGDHCQITDSQIQGGPLSALITGDAALLRGLSIAACAGITVGADSSLVASVILNDPEANDCAGSASTDVIEVTSGVARISGNSFGIASSVGGPPSFVGTVIDAGGNVCDGSLGCP